ncbi:MAG: hypothetical protein LQ343_000510 [Gyalolechia ehrenbergii]|nr:MAG: hypothetical protein LQ343_000510 [Gyalolechia ehrenbergii]
MPPFHPASIRFSACLRVPQCSRPRALVRSLRNTNPSRLLSSAHAVPPRFFRQYIWLAIASTGLGSSLLLYYIQSSHHNPTLLDAPPPSPSSPPINPSAPVQITSKDTDEDLIPTGTSTIPFFPRTIHLPPSPSSPTTQPSTSTATRTLPYGTGPPSSTEEEYQLLGLGIRKVSFLRIQVYVVGLYVAKSDLPKLQEGMVRAFFTSSASGDSTVSAATTLVDNEKTELRRVLVEGGSAGRGEKIWDEVLRESGVKSVLRIVPTRNTDFGHMREGWVRSINARSTPGKTNVLGEKREGLEESVGEFKGIFGGGRKGVGKGKVLLMSRGTTGELGVWAEDDVPEQAEKKGERGKMKYLGGLKDERISRLVWLGYLGGGNVASDEARMSVVEGVMDIVERPIGTLATQVV